MEETKHTPGPVDYYHGEWRTKSGAPWKGTDDEYTTTEVEQERKRACTDERGQDIRAFFDKTRGEVER